MGEGIPWQSHGSDSELSLSGPSSIPGGGTKNERKPRSTARKEEKKKKMGK